MVERKPFGPGSWPCPTCGGHTTIKDSRPSDALGCHAVRRRRLCLADSSHRFTTFEVLDAELAGMRNHVKALGYAADLVRELSRFLQTGEIPS